MSLDRLHEAERIRAEMDAAQTPEQRAQGDAQVERAEQYDARAAARFEQLQDLIAREPVVHVGIGYLLDIVALENLRCEALGCSGPVTWDEALNRIGYLIPSTLQARIAELRIAGSN
jgi:hypothetical protein